MVVMVSPVMFNAIAWKTYIFYAAINMVTNPIVFFCYPETAYRSLEEMDIIFANSHGVFNVVKVAQTEPNHFDRLGGMVQEHDMVADLEEKVLGIPLEAHKLDPVDHIEAKNGTE